MLIVSAWSHGPDHEAILRSCRPAAAGTAPEMVSPRKPASSRPGGDHLGGRRRRAG
jgi:hypothetical protein